MRGPSRPMMRRRKAGKAFTLLELLVVMVIIGIIITFILSAAMAGVRRAEERATQALIAKLDAGLADRIDALMSERADATPAHGYLAAVFNSALGIIGSNTRAQTLSRFELVAAQLPEVFVVQGTPGGGPDVNYPLNFGGAPFPAVAGSVVPGLNPRYAPYMLPFGIGMLNDPNAVFGTPSYGGNPRAPMVAGGIPETPETTGIFGAAYEASSGIYKNLVAQAIKNGAAPPTPIDRGYNGTDDDQNGLVDDLGENGAAVQREVLRLLGNHTHKTARSEMLYALLVEGQGPLGSVFRADDFRDNEVRDTDGDGLPEFVDAWGEPLQFYRWPIGFSDDTGTGLSTHGQKGFATYQVFEPRQQNPIDPNQKLLDPSWWDGSFNNSSPFASVQSPLSGSAYTAQTLFTLLIDPNAGAVNTGLWDRGSTWPARRAFLSRYLILSGGPDKTPGVPVLDPAYYANLGDFATVPSNPPAFAGNRPVPIATDISPGALGAGIGPLRIESQAAQATFVRANYTYYTLVGTQAEPFPGSDQLSTGIREAGNDDVTNHNLQGPGGATQ